RPITERGGEPPRRNEGAVDLRRNCAQLELLDFILCASRQFLVCKRMVPCLRDREQCNDENRCGDSWSAQNGQDFRSHHCENHHKKITPTRLPNCEGKRCDQKRG